MFDVGGCTLVVAQHPSNPKSAASCMLHVAYGAGRYRGPQLVASCMLRLHVAECRLRVPRSPQQVGLAKRVVSAEHDTLQQRMLHVARCTWSNRSIQGTQGPLEGTQGLLEGTPGDTRGYSRATRGCQDLLLDDDIRRLQQQVERLCGNDLRRAELQRSRLCARARARA
jgi:hypothetical protein